MLPLTEDFLDRTVESIDWPRYSVIGFSLTIAQVASSMAMARQIKKRHPDVKIVFGGTDLNPFFRPRWNTKSDEERENDGDKMKNE